jgi:radical SAM superfamily enzyme YgiQ (UPF0313 family)
MKLAEEVSLALKCPFKVLLVYPNLVLNVHPPLGLASLSASLKQAGAEVRLFDTTFFQTDERSYEEHKVDSLQMPRVEGEPLELSNQNMFEALHHELRSFRPSMVGITVVEPTFHLACRLIEVVRGEGIDVIAGGVFCTLNPQEVVNIPGIAGVCIGEGERAIVECCQRLSVGKGLRGIPNILTKDDVNQSIVMINSPVELDSLPYADFSIFDKRAFLRAKDGRRYITANVELDRGCPYSCSFCSAPALKAVYKEHGSCYYRRKSPERVVRELADLCEKIRPEYVNLCAETLLARPLEELEILSDLYVEKINLPFWCQTRPETVTDQKVSVLSRMGCHHIQMGVENGNEVFRSRVLNRDYSNMRVIDACESFRRAGLRFTTNNMIGLPGETRELIFETIDLNRALRPYNVKVYMFSPYRGTSLHNHCLKNGHIKDDLSYGRFSDGVELCGQPLTLAQYRGLHRTFPLYVTLPKDEYDRIREAERLDPDGDRMFMRLKVEYLEAFFQDNENDLGRDHVVDEVMM